jgi:hypothetical protein
MPEIDFAKRVDQYVRLRDKIQKIVDQQKEVLKPYKEVLERLNGEILQHLQNTNSDSVATAAGTAYRTVKQSASLADAEAFMKHVIDNEAWDLLDRKANVTAVQDYMEKNKGQLPPGVNLSRVYVAGIRRK